MNCPTFSAQMMIHDKNRFPAEIVGIAART